MLRSDPDNPARPLFQIDASGTLPDAPDGACARPGPQPLLPLPGPVAAGQPRHHALERLRHLDHRGIFPGHADRPSGIDAGHPDGYQLGPELGSDTGEIERHRAFYIFDRTIPVGFVRGQDLNIEKALLLRRYIE